jgi:hypothetical protein
LRKVAIVGMSPSALQAPMEDPEWEKWCLAWDKRRAHKADRVFEIHTREEWTHYHAKADAQSKYVEQLRSLECPIYMQKVEEDIPGSVAYPIDEVIEAGRDYFGSSIAYMLALAWYDKHGAYELDEVGIWGVELSVSDYHHQRPNLEYWIGRLEQAGVTVRVECPRGFLMRPMSERQQNGKVYKRYGWIVDKELTERPDPPEKPKRKFNPVGMRQGSANVLRG